MAKCAMCDSHKYVRLYSPDMDIEPVPLCFVCWFQILDNAKRRVDPTDGQAPQ